MEILTLENILSICIAKFIVNAKARVEHLLSICPDPSAQGWIRDQETLAQDLEGISKAFERVIYFGLQGNKDNPVSLHVLARMASLGAIKQIEKNPQSRLKDMAELICNTLVDLGYLKIIPQSIPVEKTSQYSTGFIDGCYISLPNEIDGKKVLPLREAKNYHTYSADTLGSSWLKDGNELDHCEETLELSNWTPLRWNYDILALMGNKFELAPASMDDWDPTVYDTFEEYEMARQIAFENYQGKMPEYILNQKTNKNDCFYITIKVGFIGREYIASETGNFITYKQQRAIIEDGIGEPVPDED